ARLGMLRAQPVGAVPGRGEELVAVAGLAFSRLSSHLSEGLQHLRLVALVAHLAEQPQLVAGLARMALELEELAAGEQRLGAGALGAAPVAAHGFQGAARQLPAARALGETAGVVV